MIESNFQRRLNIGSQLKVLLLNRGESGDPFTQAFMMGNCNNDPLKMEQEGAMHGPEPESIVSIESLGFTLDRGREGKDKQIARGHRNLLCNLLCNLLREGVRE